MKRFLLYLIPILTLVAFIIIMNSGSFLKEPLGEDDRLFEAVSNIEEDINQKDWVRAKENIEYSEQAWEKITRRIQFSVEKEYIIEISGVLSRIKGGIEAEDDKAIMEEIYYYYELWDHLAQ